MGREAQKDGVELMMVKRPMKDLDRGSGGTYMVMKEEQVMCGYIMH